MDDCIVYTYYYIYISCIIFSYFLPRAAHTGIESFGERKARPNRHRTHREVTQRELITRVSSQQSGLRGDERKLDDTYGVRPYTYTSIRVCGVLRVSFVSLLESAFYFLVTSIHTTHTVFHGRILYTALRLDYVRT